MLQPDTAPSSSSSEDVFCIQNWLVGDDITSTTMKYCVFAARSIPDVVNSLLPPPNGLGFERGFPTRTPGLSLPLSVQMLTVRPILSIYES